MRPGRRFLLIGLAVAAAEGVLALLMAGTALSGYFLGCAAASAALAWGGRRLFEPRPGEEPPPRGGTADGPDLPDPPWWPDFEAQFRRHVRDRGGSPV